MKAMLILGLVIFHLPALPSAISQDQPMMRVRYDLDLMRAWVRDTNALRRDVTDGQGHVLDQIFDWDEIARRSFRDNWINLSKHWQSRLTQALRRKLIVDVSGFMAGLEFSLAEKNLRWGEERITEGEARVVVDVLRRDDWQRLSLRLTQRSGEWMLYEIRTGDVRVIGDRVDGFDALVSEGYSNEYVEAAIRNSVRVTVDEFTQSPNQSFPRQWGWRKKDDNVVRRKQLFRVESESENPYLVLRSHDNEVALVRPFVLPLREFRYLSWKWRIKGGDGEHRLSGRLAGIAVIFYQNWLGMPVTIRYEWNGSAQPCNVIKEEGWLYDTYIRVIHSGGGGKDSTWESETIDVWEDFRRLFNEEPPDQIVGVFLINPAESVEAHFDDIMFLRHSKTESCKP